MPFQQLTYEFGTLLVAWEREQIVYLDFGLNVERARTYLAEETDEEQLPKAWRSAFDRYAQGDVQALDTLPCQLRVTPFAETVLQALRNVPFGQTISYGELARMIGKPKAARAVGGALNRNPIALIYPCHRVIGATGKMTGFASGIAHKEALLAHEIGEN
ncbi:methylated-DNA--[protein]-cysteine S-methyltransferase [Exiguobacterium acetylicum]|uniref:methylated-DNA--[protein]-cysteine S-methyltransferase n=1 Tax=Exiguobacterium acetylicum TaxID=41170 RepID=UPI0024B66F29|nr:methylated-DNA--[protein]-cysteine S-methyltransferase [Exiguobacterium acetylicum]UKS56733.1 methylated-DNA--[protein]-cysteine S-methyltransferase [Exiguobacterium acetylicum]